MGRRPGRHVRPTATKLLDKAGFFWQWQFGLGALRTVRLLLEGSIAA